MAVEVTAKRPEEHARNTNESSFALYRIEYL